MNTHDSGPEWLARPSPYETLTHYLPSVSPTLPLITTSQHGYPLRSGWSAVWIPERQNGRG